MTIGIQAQAVAEAIVATTGGGSTLSLLPLVAILFVRAALIGDR